MKIDCPWASTEPASGPAARASANATTKSRFDVMHASFCSLVRERPQSELLLRDLPQPREPVGLDDQEEEDEPTEHHQLDLFGEGHGQVQSHGVGDVRE